VQYEFIKIAATAAQSSFETSFLPRAKQLQVLHMYVYSFINTQATQVGTGTQARVVKRRAAQTKGKKLRNV